MSVPITKATENADGSIDVEGLCTDDDLDLDEQIIDRDFATKGLATWFQDWANVRQMHSPNLPPAGTAVQMEPRPNGIWVRTHVYEPGAVLQVKNGGYKAYSVGIAKPRIIRDGVAKNGRVVDGVFSEISLVDFPANPRSRFQLAKRAKLEDTAPIEIVEKVVAPALTKMVEPDMVNISINLDGQAVMSPADMGRLLTKIGKATGVAKRDMDPDVGGGVDRDKLPASDFVFPAERDFPVPTPADVPDAVSSWGQYKGPHSFDEFKTKLTALADRKGPKFAAELPNSWKDNDTATKTTVPAVAKADDDEKCGTCKGEKKIREGHVDCPDCGGSGLAKDVKKGADAEVVKGSKDCTNCGKSHDADSDHKFCSDCGSKLPVKKSTEAETAKTLADHNEPDGDEAGPDVDGDGDGHSAADDDEDGEDDRIGKSLPYRLRRLHDATCAAYHEPDVLAAHPALAKGIPAAVDAPAFAAAVAKALNAPIGDQVFDVPAMADAYTLAAQLSAADPSLLEQAMGEVRKSFSEYYPDAHPKPSTMTPGSFKRPYLSTGHATQAAKSGQKPRIPLASHVPDPGDFQRPLITTGHEAAAPGSMAKGRTYYSNAAKETASGVLTEMHDYIVEQHPGVCPMVGPTPDGEPALANPGGSTLTRAAAASSTMDMQATATPTAVSAEQAASVVTKAADPDALAQLIKEAVRAATDPISEELQSLGKRLGDLESAPDPASAAFRGSGTALAALRGAAANEDPAGRVNAEDTERVAGLVKRAKTRDSTVARPAMQELAELVGADQAVQLLTK